MTDGFGPVFKVCPPLFVEKFELYIDKLSMMVYNPKRTFVLLRVHKR